jgi:DnaJ-domain-containing protein 1
VSRIPRWSASGGSARSILARLDGSLDLSDIAALTGVAEEEVERLLEPLTRAGLVAVGEEAAPASAAAAHSIVPPGIRAEGQRSSVEMPRVAAPPPLSEEEARRIAELHAKLNKIDHYRLLGVAATADLKTIKRAYFALAKLHHPDRFFRKDTGALRPKIEAIFAAMTTALDTLSDPQRRADYDAHLRDVLRTRMTRRSAEALEARGDWAGAAEIWSRVVEALSTDAYAHHRHAYALLRSRQALSAALAAAIRAIELDPGRAEYRVTAASLYVAVGRDRSAAAELAVAIELEPDRVDLAGLLAAVSERIDRARDTRP